MSMNFKWSSTDYTDKYTKKQKREHFERSFSGTDEKFKAEIGLFGVLIFNRA